MNEMKTPLIDLLRGIPANARLEWEDSPTSWHQAPVGRYCKEAAAELSRLRAENERLKSRLEMCADTIQSLAAVARAKGVICNERYKQAQITARAARTVSILGEIPLTPPAAEGESK